MPQALYLDQYSLTMAQFYWRKKMNDPVTFELFVRSLPKNRGYLAVAGLGTALWALREMSFTVEDIDYLRSQEIYDEDFLQYLHNLDLSLDVWAMPEGTIAFPGEPILRVTGPRIEGTLVESLLLSIINHQTMIASKASRIVTAAHGVPVWDFSLRRLHGPEASIGVARAAYIAGCAGTATVEAGRILKIPTTGTMAHAMIMAYGEEREEECFRDVLRQYPENHALLIDTFDTEQGINKAIHASIETNIPLRAVRVDSNLVDSVPLVNANLAGASYAKPWFSETVIVASNDLDEYAISQMRHLHIGAYGVGTMLGTSADAPNLGGVYKLVAQTREPRFIMKLTEGKQTDPGAHQVWRYPGMGDFISLSSESRLSFEEEDSPIPYPLLHKVMTDGRLTDPLPSLDEAKARHRDQRALFSAGVFDLTNPEPYPVNRSEALWELRARLGDKAAAEEILRRKEEARS